MTRNEMAKSEFKCNGGKQPARAYEPRLAGRIDWPQSTENPHEKAGEENARTRGDLMRRQFRNAFAVCGLTEHTVSNGHDGQQEPAQ